MGTYHVRCSGLLLLAQKDLNLDSIKETIKQLDNVGGGELLIPQEINYGYEKKYSIYMGVYYCV